MGGRRAIETPSADRRARRISILTEFPRQVSLDARVMSRLCIRIQASTTQIRRRPFLDHRGLSGRFAFYDRIMSVDRASIRLDEIAEMCGQGEAANGTREFEADDEQHE